MCLSSFWTTDEVVRHSALDADDWSFKHDNVDRGFLPMVLAFFAASDGTVAENLAPQFMVEVQVPEAHSFYGLQIAM